MRIERRKFVISASSVVGLGLAGCMGFGGGGDGDGDSDDEEGEVNRGDFQMSDIELTSSAFDHNGDIPAKYTDDGEDVSPPLTLSNVPDDAETLAIVMDDPDAKEVAGKIWVHWLIWNIPADTTEIPEAVPQERTVSEPGNARQGKNDFSSNDIGYRGPAPPSGTHTYQFKLYALDTTLDTSPGATKDKLLEDMDGHVVGRTVLKGDYGR